jgi:hypothetical protein
MIFVQKVRESSVVGLSHLSSTNLQTKSAHQQVQTARHVKHSPCQRYGFSAKVLDPSMIPLIGGRSFLERKKVKNVGRSPSIGAPPSSTHSNALEQYLSFLRTLCKVFKPASTSLTKMMLQFHVKPCFYTNLNLLKIRGLATSAFRRLQDRPDKCAFAVQI